MEMVRQRCLVDKRETVEINREINGCSLAIDCHDTKLNKEWMETWKYGVSIIYLFF